MTCLPPRRATTSMSRGTTRRFLPSAAVAVIVTGLTAGVASAHTVTAPDLTIAAVASTPPGSASGDAPGDKSVPRAGLPPLTGSSDTSATTGAPFAAGASATPLRVVPVSSTAAFTAALAASRAGDKIVLSAGTYTGPFEMRTSGTADDPIVVAPEAGAAVTLMTPGLKYPPCNAGGPDEARTVSFTQGASHWVISGLNINGGLKISSKNADATQKWQSDKVARGDWNARRSVPGAGERDPGAAGTAISYLAGITHTALGPSDDIQMLGNTFVGKGIFGRLTRYGVFSDNTVTNIACGTGPAFWMTNFSNGWVVSGNDVSDVAHSTRIHYMQEGIRFGNGSDYNVISGNDVHDLPVDGRAITTDQDSSWNVITGNAVSNVDIAYNEQMSTWGNVWTLNTADSAREAAFSFRMEDIRLTAPSKATSSYFASVTCNTATNSPIAVQAGAMASASFSNNSFATAKVGKALAGYWGRQGNLWDGAPTPPSRTPTPSAPC